MPPPLTGRTIHDVFSLLDTGSPAAPGYYILLPSSTNQAAASAAIYRPEFAVTIPVITTRLKQYLATINRGHVHTWDRLRVFGTSTFIPGDEYDPHCLGGIWMSGENGRCSRLNPGVPYNQYKGPLKVTHVPYTEWQYEGPDVALFAHRHTNPGAMAVPSGANTEQNRDSANCTVHVWNNVIMYDEDSYNFLGIHRDNAISRPTGTEPYAGDYHGHELYYSYIYAYIVHGRFADPAFCAQNNLDPNDNTLVLANTPVFVQGQDPGDPCIISRDLLNQILIDEHPNPMSELVFSNKQHTTRRKIYYRMVHAIMTTRDQEIRAVEMYTPIVFNDPTRNTHFYVPFNTAFYVSPVCADYISRIELMVPCYIDDWDLPAVHTRPRLARLLPDNHQYEHAISLIIAVMTSLFTMDRTFSSAKYSNTMFVGHHSNTIIGPSITMLSHILTPPKPGVKRKSRLPIP
jgi:hypothetical protein